MAFHQGEEMPKGWRRSSTRPQPVALPQTQDQAGDRAGSINENRTCGNLFECSPLNCNGCYDDVTVNRYCLLDDLETAVQLARHWSCGRYDANRTYSGPAEPGPYFIIEVLRKRLPVSAVPGSKIP